MPLQIINKEYIDFKGRTGDSFKGNTWDKVVSKIDVELNLTVNLSSAIAVILNKEANPSTIGTFTLTSGTWSDLIGAYNGANIEFQLGKGQTITTTIDFVDGVNMTLTNVGNYAGNGADYFTGYFTITDVPEQFEVFLNLTQNSVGQDNASLIDNEVIRLKVAGVDSLAANDPAVILVQQGNKSGGSIIESPTLQRIDDASNGNSIFRIILSYKFWLFIDPSVFDAANAIGESYEIIAVMQENDPSAIASVTTYKRGNTGLKDENFNQQPSIYTHDSTVWKESTNVDVIPTMDFAQKSFCAIDISGTFNPSDRFNIKLFTLPNDSSEYTNRPSPVENNVMLVMNDLLIANATPTAISGNLNDDGAGIDITNFNVINNGSDIEVTFETNPTAEFTTLFENRQSDDRKYFVWIYCEDNTKAFDEANTVNVVCDESDATKNLLPLGKLTTVSSFKMFDHNDDDMTVTPQAYLEDDILTELLFTLPKDTVDNPWQIFQGRIVARSVGGDEFTLESFEHDLAQYPAMPDGTLSIDSVQNRGFKLPATSDKHDFTLQLYPSLDTGSDFGVRMAYPFIARYETWLQQLNADDYFFGNKTKNWFTYDSDPNWSVRFEYGLQTAEGEFTDFLDFAIHDYDDWGEVPGASWEFFKLDNTPIDRPFEDEQTRIVAKFIVDTEDWNGDEWGVLHARPQDASPQWMSSSVLDFSDVNNPLTPVTGSVKAKLTVVSLKLVTVECIFDPAKINFSNGVTLSMRIDGSTTGGVRRVVYEEDFRLARKPFLPQLRNSSDEPEEDRGYEMCCCEELVLASLAVGDDHPSKRYKQDVLSAWGRGDTVTFVLKKDGVVTSYTPVSIPFPNELDVYYTTIEWSHVLLSDDVGCYTLEIESTSAGVPNDTIVWREMTFNLAHYLVSDRYMGQGTVRLLSEFNDVNDNQGIDFTDARLLSSLRVSAKFAYWQQNSVRKNVEYQNGKVEKVIHEDFRSYELRTNLICNATNEWLLFHFRAENSTWVSDHNFDNPDYFIRDIPVIVKEGESPEIEFFDGSREVKTIAVLEEKNRITRTHFSDNRQTAEALAPPGVCPPLPATGTGCLPLKTAQVISYRTGDDGDFQAGRLVGWFTLSSINPFGNTDRFTDELGTQVYANDIVIDWSTYNGTIVIGWYRILSAMMVWNDAIDQSVLVSIGTYTTGWRLPQLNELGQLAKWGASGRLMDYAPFGFINQNNILFSGSTYDSAPTQAFGMYFQMALGQRAKVTNSNYLPCREFTVTGTVLT